MKLAVGTCPAISSRRTATGDTVVSADGRTIYIATDPEAWRKPLGGGLGENKPQNKAGLALHMGGVRVQNPDQPDRKRSRANTMLERKLRDQYEYRRTLYGENAALQRQKPIPNALPAIK